MLVLALLAASSVCGAQQAYVFPPGNNQKGEIIPKEKLNFVLYTKEKCALPIVHAKDMRKAVAYGVTPPLVGCWGRTLSAYGDTVLYVSPTGFTDEMHLGEMVGADFQKDGSAIIIEPSHYLEDMRRRFPPIR